MGYTPLQIAINRFLSGRERLNSLKKILDEVWYEADIEWNPWLEDQLQSLCDDTYVESVGTTSIRVVSWTGPGSAGKTFASGLYAMAWFLCDPLNSCVTLTSTSKTSIGYRVWPVIQNLYSSARDPKTGMPFGWHLVDSKKELQWPRGSSKNSVAAFAVEPGEVLKSIDKIKGRHTPRMLLIIDEANSTPEAIFKTIPNMLKGVEEIVILTIGNAVSRFDNHGRACEPKAGWNSIRVDDARWQTRGVNEWGVLPGLCCHYDGATSPNVLAKRTKYRHIYSWENHLQASRWGTKNMHYWSQDRGFWAPEGTVNTVFSDPLITRCDGTGYFTFLAPRVMYAFLDPAFGGDRCVLQFAEVSETDQNKPGVQLLDPVYIEPEVDDEAERDYQIARKVIEECKFRNVQPNRFGTDATGIGRGVHAIIAAEWSSEIVRVEFGGRASDKPSSQADGRPSLEVYDNRVTELWFSVREFLEAGQIKGFYQDAIVQACSREYEQIGRKYRMASKADCKTALGRSPDEMDAIAGLIEVVRQNGVLANGKESSARSSSWETFRKKVEDGLGLPPIEEGESAIAVSGWADADIHQIPIGVEWRE